MPMYTLGHDFVPPPVHAGGLRYHGDAPMVCALVRAGRVEARAYRQNETFEAAVQFARTRGDHPGARAGARDPRGDRGGRRDGRGEDDPVRPLRPRALRPRRLRRLPGRPLEDPEFSEAELEAALARLPRGARDRLGGAGGAARGVSGGGEVCDAVDGEAERAGLQQRGGRLLGQPAAAGRRRSGRRPRRRPRCRRPRPAPRRRRRRRPGRARTAPGGRRRPRGPRRRSRRGGRPAGRTRACASRPRAARPASSSRSNGTGDHSPARIRVREQVEHDGRGRRRRAWWRSMSSWPGRSRAAAPRVVGRAADRGRRRNEPVSSSADDAPIVRREDDGAAPPRVTMSRPWPRRSDPCSRASRAAAAHGSTR